MMSKLPAFLGRPYLYALGSILLWSTLAGTSMFLSTVPPFMLVGLTLLVGSSCGWTRMKEWRVPLSTCLLGVYGLFGYHFALFMALRNAPAVEANLLNYLWPILTVLLSPLFLKDHAVNRFHAFAGILGLSGAFLVMTGGSVSFSATHWGGYAWAVAAALIWSSYSLFTKRVQHFGTGAVGLFCLLSGVLSLGCHFILESPYQPSAQDWILIFVLGIGPMGIAFFLWDAALKAGDPRVIGALSYVDPLLSTLFLVAVGKGTLNWVSAVALALILSGALLGAMQAHEPDQKQT